MNDQERWLAQQIEQLEANGSGRDDLNRLKQYRYELAQLREQP